MRGELSLNISFLTEVALEGFRILNTSLGSSPGNKSRNKHLICHFSYNISFDNVHTDKQFSTLGHHLHAYDGLPIHFRLLGHGPINVLLKNTYTG